MGLIDRTFLLVGKKGVATFEGRRLFQCLAYFLDKNSQHQRKFEFCNVNEGTGPVRWGIFSEGIEDEMTDKVASMLVAESGLTPANEALINRIRELALPLEPVQCVELLGVLDFFLNRVCFPNFTSAIGKLSEYENVKEWMHLLDQEGMTREEVFRSKVEQLEALLLDELHKPTALSASADASTGANAVTISVVLPKSLWDECEYWIKGGLANNLSEYMLTAVVRLTHERDRPYVPQELEAYARAGASELREIAFKKETLEFIDTTVLEHGLVNRDQFLGLLAIEFGEWARANVCSGDPSEILSPIPEE